MVKIRRMRCAPYVSVLLLVVMYIAPAASAAKTAVKPAPAPVKTIAVFPFDTSGEGTAADLSPALLNSITASLSEFGGYRAFSYSKQLPSIQRAQQEATLKPTEVDGPFGVDKDKVATALKIARETGADMMMVGVVEDAKVDTAKKTAEVTLTALVADVNTGETLKNAAVSGQVPAGAVATTESELLALAAGDAVTKLVKAVALAPNAAPVVATPVVKKKSSRSKSLLYVLLLGAVVGIASSSGGSSGGSGDDLPPPPP